MNLRRKLLAFLQSQKKGAEYTELEWIGNEENCYIFFPLVTAGKDIIELEYEAQFTRTDVPQAEGKNGDPYFFIGLQNSVWYAGCGGYGNSSVKADTEWHHFRLVSYGDDNGFWLDGTRIYQSTPQDGVYLPQGFRLWIGQGGTRTTYNRKKYVKVKVNGKLVYDLIPVLDKDFVPCMYDKLTGKYFYNEGNGEFKWKLPNQLEYLESTGEQYIDTGFLSKDLADKSLCIKMKTTGGTSSYAYNGAYHISGSGLTIQVGLLATSDTLCRTTLNHFDPSYLNVVDLPKSEFTEMMMTPTEYWVNGEFKATHEQTSVDKILETNNPFLIFGRSQYNQPNSITPMIISKFWVKNASGKYIQYLIPAFDENLTPCMYDLVSKKYLYNQGSGVFKGFFEDGSQIVSYLSATGTQWIDTGIVPLMGDELELKNVQCKKKSSGMQAVFSAGTGNYQLIILVADGGYSDRASFYKYFASGGAKNINPPNYLNDPTTIKIDGEGNVYYNGTFIIQSPPEKETDSSLRLFYRANDSQPMTGNIGAVNVKRNGEFVINLVPVVKIDGTACMFDLVSKKYLPNAGSGEFSYK